MLLSKLINWIVQSVRSIEETEKYQLEKAMLSTIYMMEQIVALDGRTYYNKKDREHRFNANDLVSRWVYPFELRVEQPLIAVHPYLKLDSAIRKLFWNRSRPNDAPQISGLEVVLADDPITESSIRFDEYSASRTRWADRQKTAYISDQNNLVQICKKYLKVMSDARRNLDPATFEKTYCDTFAALKNEGLGQIFSQSVVNVPQALRNLSQLYQMVKKYSKLEKKHSSITNSYCFNEFRVMESELAALYKSTRWIRFKNFFSFGRSGKEKQLFSRQVGDLGAQVAANYDVGKYCYSNS